MESVRRKRVAGEETEGWLKERDIEMQSQERFERVQKSRWNRWYKKAVTLELPRYLRKRGKEESIVRIARFRLESKMKEGRYWEEDDKKRCRDYVDGGWNRGRGVYGESKRGGKEEIIRWHYSSYLK